MAGLRAWIWRGKGGGGSCFRDHLYGERGVEWSGTVIELSTWGVARVEEGNDEGG